MRTITAALVAFVLFIVLAILSGCMTTYDIQACNPESGTCTSVNVKSFREFEQPEVHYTRTPNGIEFSFGAESAATATSPIEAAVGDVIRSGGTLSSTGDGQ